MVAIREEVNDGMKRTRKAVTLTEVIVVAVLFSMLTVAISYSFVPIVARTQAEFITATLMGDYNNFHVMLTRDFRNSSNATLSNNRLVLRTTYVDTPYVIYIFEPSNYEGMQVRRVGAKDANGTNVVNEILLIRGGIVSTPKLQRDPDTRLNILSFDFKLPTGTHQVSVLGWSRM